MDLVVNIEGNDLVIKLINMSFMDKLQYSILTPSGGLKIAIDHITAVKKNDLAPMTSLGLGGKGNIDLIAQKIGGVQRKAFHAPFQGSIDGNKVIGTFSTQEGVAMFFTKDLTNATKLYIDDPKAAGLGPTAALLKIFVLDLDEETLSKLNSMIRK